MRSTASLFNKTLFKNDFKRLWPLWVVFSIISALIGISFIYGLRNTYQPEKLTFLDTRSYYFEAASGMGPIAAMALSCIVTAAIWGFLCTGKSTVFFHSVPVTRTTMFFTNLVTSFVIVIIPLLTGWFVFTVGSASMGLFDAHGMLITLWALIAETVAMLGVAILCAQLTGRLAAMVLLDLTANVFFAVAEAVITAFAVNFYYGVSSLDDIGLYMLSPVVALVSKLTPKDAELYGAGYLAVYCIVGLVLTVMAYFLYKIRKSESATEVIAFKPLKPILLYSYATVGTIFMTWLLYDLFNISGSGTYDIRKLIVLLIISGTLMYFVGRMIIDRTIKVFTLKYFFGYCAMLAWLIIGTVVIALDPFRVEWWVPEKENVTAVKINSNMGEMFLGENDDGLIGDLLEVHKVLAGEGERHAANDEVTEFYLDLTYYMTDGRLKVREYRVPIYEENLDNTDSVESRLDHFFNLEPVREKSFHIGKEFVFESAWIYVSHDLESVGDETDLTASEGIRLKEAILEDLRAGNIPPTDIFDNAISVDEDEFITIDLCDMLNHGQRYIRDSYSGHIYEVDDSRYGVYHSFTVPDSMTATRAYLKEIGVIE